MASHHAGEILHALRRQVAAIEAHGARGIARPGRMVAYGTGWGADAAYDPSPDQRWSDPPLSGESEVRCDRPAGAEGAGGTGGAGGAGSAVHAGGAGGAAGAGRAPKNRALAFGIPTLDQALSGGLARGALHEIAPYAPFDFGAGAAFALALLVRAVREDGRDALWIEPEAAEREGGCLYGPGLDGLGLPMARVIGLRVARERDGAWAMEEALRSRALAAVVGEFMREGALDLTMLRRLSLAAGAGGGFGFLLRHRPSARPSPAMTRFAVAAAPGLRDPFSGLGRPAVLLTLVRNRRGPPGRWLLSWDHHEHAFFSAPLSLDLAAPAGDRPLDPLLRAQAG
jgi:protein ImuA